MLALLLLLLPCLAFAQPDTTWSRSFQLGARCHISDGVYAGNNTIAFCGLSVTAENDSNFMIGAYTASGESLYVRTILDAAGTQGLDGIAYFAEDTVVAVGYSFQGGRKLDLVSFVASTGEVLWNHTYDGSGRSKGRDIVRLADGRLAAVGYRLGNNGSRSDAWLIMCSAQGDTLWTTNFGDAQTDVGNAILQKPNGNMFLGADFKPDEFQSDMWGVEVDLDGNQVGANQFFGGTDDDKCFGAVLDPSGNIRLMGRTGPDNNIDSYVAVIPAEGTPYTRSYSTNAVNEYFRAGIPWFGGMLYVGRAGTTETTTRFYMRAVDINENSLWSWQYGVIGTDGGFYSVVASPNGGAIALGTRVVTEGDTRGYLLGVSPPAGAYGVVLGQSDDQPIAHARVHAVGDERFSITNSAGEYRLELSVGSHDLVVEGFCIETDTVYDVTVAENELAEINFSPGQPVFGDLHSSVNLITMNEEFGSVEVPLRNIGTGNLSFNVQVVALDPPGAWIEVLPESGLIPPGETIPITVTVLAETTNTGAFDFYGRITLRSNSCPDTVLTIPVLVAVLDAEERGDLPAQFALSPAYPNPFNGQTSVMLELPAETDVRLEVFNLQGRWVETLADNRFVAGSHRININLNQHATGVYLLRAQMAEAVSVQKLLYLR